jgi:hypothetical protein
VLEEPVSPWFAACKEELGYLLAVRDFGDAPLLLSVVEDCLPFGANYVVRAAEQRRFPYDPELGMAPGRNRVGEETQVLRAILAAGGMGYYLPDAVSRHMIAPSRQTISYVRSYYRGHGETAAMAGGYVHGWRFGTLPLWLWRQIVTEALTYALTLVCFLRRASGYAI